MLDTALSSEFGLCLVSLHTAIVMFCLLLAQLVVVSAEVMLCLFWYFGMHTFLQLSNACSELCKVLFLALSVTFLFVCVYYFVSDCILHACVVL